jgi:hypothetical protein
MAKKHRSGSREARKPKQPKASPAMSPEVAAQKPAGAKKRA